MTQGVAAPGLFFHLGWNRWIDRFQANQLPVWVVLRGIERRHVHPRHLSQLSQPLRTRCLSAVLQRIDEGGQQQFTVPEQHGIKKRCKGLGVGREHRSAAEHDRVLIPPLQGPDRNPLVLQQFRQHRSIQFPAQGEPEQIDVAWHRIALIGEQPAHVHIRPLRKRRPDDLIAEAGDPHGIGAGKGQHGLEGLGVRRGRIEEQRFLVQLGSPVGPDGGVGGVNGRL